MKLDINNEMKVFLKKLLVTILSVLSLVLAPLFTLVTLLDLSFSSLYNIIQLYSFILPLGVLTVLLTVTLFKINNISKTWLAITLSKEILYSTLILLWALTSKISIKVETFEIFFDTSALILVFLGIPLLTTVKQTFNFIGRRKLIRNQLTVLKAIKENDRINTNRQIKKLLTRNSIKITNLSAIIDMSLNNEPPLLKKRGSLNLTKKGLQYLERYESKFFKNIIILDMDHQEVPLQVWTEEDLKNELLNEVGENRS